MKKLALALSILALLCGCGNRPPSSLIVVGVYPKTPSDIDMGQSLSFSARLISNDPKVSLGGVTWTASGPGCAGSACGTFTNVTDTTATYVAPATVSVALSVTVTATSVNQPQQSSSSSFNVTPPPTIVTTDLPVASPTYLYHAQISAKGGVQPLNWTVVSGTLPSGISLNSGGVLFGTATAGSTTTITVQATDSSGSPSGQLSAQHTFTFTVAGLLTLDGGALPDGKVGTAYSTQLTANGGIPPFSWAVYNGTLPSGLLLQKSGAISGTPTLPGTTTFQLRVIDSSPIQQFFVSPDYTLTVDPAGPLAIRTTGLMDATVDQFYRSQLVATGGTPPLVWTQTSGALPSGLALDPLSGTITGTVTAAPGTYPFAIQVGDTSTPEETATQNLSITVNAAAAACTSSGHESVLVGQYAFSLTGYNSSGYLAVVGSFTADGTGNITAGEADSNGVLGAQTASLITSASSYSVGPDNRGCATLATPFGTFSTRFAVGSVTNGVANTGRIIEFESPGPNAYIAAGPLVLQNPMAFIAGLTGSYEIQTSGWDPAAPGRFACVGIIAGAKNKFNTLQEDCNDNGTVASYNNTSTNANTQVNTYSAADTNGRGTGIFAVGQGTSSVTFYWVSLTQLFVVNTDPGPYYAGTWQQPVVPQGSRGFQQNHFEGNLAYYSSGLAPSQAAGNVLLATETSDGVSSVASKFYLDSGGVWTDSTTACNYTVVLNGGVTLAGTNCGANPPVLFLTSLNNAIVMGTDPTVELGLIEPLTSNLTTGALAGTYYLGTSEVVNQQAQAEVGILTLAGNGVVTSTLDVASTLAQTAGVSNSDTLVLNADGTFSTGTSAGTTVGIAINSSKFVITGNPTLTFPTLQIGQR